MMNWEQLLSLKRQGDTNKRLRKEQDETRLGFEVDYDRIVFSPAFRSLQDKTQVVPLSKTSFVHTRLTHSLEVSVVGRSLGRAVTWTGLGSIDKTFGLFFGLFKGYVVSVCLFSILNWFYPYGNWGISVEKALTFEIIKKGSDVLIEEFPSNEDFIDTKEKIEKI